MKESREVGVQDGWETCRALRWKPTRVSSEPASVTGKARTTATAATESELWATHTTAEPLLPLSRPRPVPAHALCPDPSHALGVGWRDTSVQATFSMLSESAGGAGVGQRAWLARKLEDITGLSSSPCRWRPALLPRRERRDEVEPTDVSRAACGSSGRRSLLWPAVAATSTLAEPV